MNRRDKFCENNIVCDLYTTGHVPVKMDTVIEYMTPVETYTSYLSASVGCLLCAVVAITSHIE